MVEAAHGVKVQPLCRRRATLTERRVSLWKRQHRTTGRIAAPEIMRARWPFHGANLTPLTQA